MRRAPVANQGDPVTQTTVATPLNRLRNVLPTGLLHTVCLQRWAAAPSASLPETSQTLLHRAWRTFRGFEGDDDSSSSPTSALPNAAAVATIKVGLPLLWL